MLLSVTLPLTWDVFLNLEIGILSGSRLNHYGIFQLSIVLFCLLQGRQLQQHSALMGERLLLRSELLINGFFLL